MNVTILLLFHYSNNDTQSYMQILYYFVERSVFMKFPHRNFFLTTLLLTLFCIPMPAFAAFDSLSVNIDDTETTLQAFTDGASTFITASDLALIFETEYTHTAENNEISYVLRKTLFGKKEAVFTIDSNTIVLNGKKIELTAAPVLFDDTVLIPSEVLSVVWDAAYGANEETLYIHTDGSEVIVPEIPKVFVEKQSVAIGDKNTLIRYIRIPAVSDLKADIVLASNRIGATEELEDIAVRSSAKAAINGSFFQSFDETKTQEPYGILIKDGKLIHSDNTGSTIGFTHDGKIKLDMIHSNIQIKIADTNYTASLMNHSPAVGNDAIVLFTPAYGDTLISTGAAVIVQNGMIHSVSNSKTVTIPSDGYVVLFTGNHAEKVKDFQKNDIVSYTISYLTEDNKKIDWSDVQTAVGAGPILVNNGKIVCNPAKEGFTDETSFQIAVSRSAIGITKDGTVLLVGGVKCTADELAAVMVELGAVQAIAMDSGSSSGLYSITAEPVAAPMKAISNALIFK